MPNQRRGPAIATRMGRGLANGPAVPDHPVGWSLRDAALLFLGAHLVSFLWAAVVIMVVHDGELPDPIPIDSLFLINIGLWVGYGLGPLMVSWSKGSGPVADFGGRLRAPDAPLYLVAGVVVQLVVLPVLYLPILRFVDGDPSADARRLIDSIEGPAQFGLFALSVVVIAPFVEELFFRGLLLRALQQRLGNVVSVVVSAAVFALVHRQLLPLLGLFVFGVAAAVITLRTGRLGPAWFLHAGFNLATLVVLGLV